MENKAHALIAGLFTVAMLMAAIVIGVYLSRDRIERVPYDLYTTMSVQGLNPQAAVRYRGLNVGNVERIQFDPKVPGQIVLRLNIRKETPVTHGTYAMLSYQGVTGIAFVQLNDDGSNPAPLVSSREDVKRLELRPGLIDQLQERGLAILQQADKLTRRLNEIAGQENEQKLTATVDEIRAAAVAFQRIPGMLSPTLHSLPGMVDESRQAAASVNRLTKNLDGLTTSLQSPDGALNRTARAAEEAAAAANQAERAIPQLTRDVRGALRSVRGAADTVAERPQSLIFGGPAIVPGPGEPGFQPAPASAEATPGRH